MDCVPSPKGWVPITSHIKKSAFLHFFSFFAFCTFFAFLPNLPPGGGGGARGRSKNQKIKIAGAILIFCKRCGLEWVPIPPVFFPEPSNFLSMAWGTQLGGIPPIPSQSKARGDTLDDPLSDCIAGLHRTYWCFIVFVKKSRDPH